MVTKEEKDLQRRLEGLEKKYKENLFPDGEEKDFKDDFDVEQDEEDSEIVEEEEFTVPESKRSKFGGKKNSLVANKDNKKSKKTPVRKKFNVVKRIRGRASSSEIKKAAESIKLLKDEMGKVLIGQEDIVDGLIRGLLCNAHVLVEGVPGIAKTLAIRALAQASGCEVKRIQFTVDMLPTDIIGITSYTPDKGFEVVKGPIFTNFIIADEINRAPPKCVLGDTPVIMESGKVSNIKEIIKKYNGKGTYKRNNEYWIVPKKSLKLLAFDVSDCKIKPEEVKYLYKQKTSEPFYEVELRSGRKIKTSKIHPFFTLENDKVKTISAEELKKGACVLIPRKLSISGSNKLIYNKRFLDKSQEIEKEILRRKELYDKFNYYKKSGKNYKEILEELKIVTKADENLIRTFLTSKPRYFKYFGRFFSDSKQFGQIRGIKRPDFFTKDFARFMAILIAEANVNKSYFYLTMKDKEIPELFINLVKNLFDLDANLLYDKKREQYRVAFRSDALVNLLKALGYHPHSKAGKKYIPNFILTSSDDAVKEFLKLYYECDGCVSRDCVKVTTKSKEIANSLSYLLLRLGFVAKINKELSKTKIGGYSYERNFFNLRLYGPELHDFYEKINFFREENSEKLKRLIKNTDKKFSDLIPGMHSVIRDFRKKSGLSHREFHELTGMHAHNLENPKNSLMHSRYRLRKISDVFKGSSFPITRLIDGDFSCDFVKDSRLIKPKKDYWLYDFSMKNNHSFVAGFGGIISHNTQSALIEGMQEKQVTIGRKKYILPDPFFVMATENPIENAGVYPLPEAQIDRFLFKLMMGYPEEDEEREIMATNMTIQKFEDFGLKAVITPKRILEMQESVKKIYLDDNIKTYILSIVRKTRDRDFDKSEYLTYGSSPRASIGLFIASKARALMEGRDYVLPEDVKKVVYDVLRHRLILSYKATIDKVSPDAIIKSILESVRVE